MHGIRLAMWALALSAGLGWPTAQAGGGIKCWTNSEGVRECGNAVPPEYSQQGHQEVSKQGIVIDEKARAKTEEEVAAERRAAAEKLEQERLARERAATDRVLLDTFSSEDDILMTRDGKLAALDSQIRLTESHIFKLQTNLDELIAEAAESERRGTPPAEATVRDIDSLRDQISGQRTFIAAKQAEQEAIRHQFNVDLERFRELKASQASSGATP